MIILNYEIKKKKDKDKEYVPASERIKAVRKDAVYSTIMTDKNIITIPTPYNEKHPEVQAWIVDVMLYLSYQLPGGKWKKERHSGSAIQVIDGSDYGTPSSALSTAHTMAVSKALAMAGIGIDDQVAGLEEIMGSGALESTKQKIAKVQEKLSIVKNEHGIIPTPDVIEALKPNEQEKPTIEGLEEMKAEDIWSILGRDKDIGVFIVDKKLTIKRRFAAC